MGRSSNAATASSVQRSPTRASASARGEEGAAWRGRRMGCRGYCARRTATAAGEESVGRPPGDFGRDEDNVPLNTGQGFHWNETRLRGGQRSFNRACTLERNVVVVLLRLRSPRRPGRVERNLVVPAGPPNPPPHQPPLPPAPDRRSAFTPAAVRHLAQAATPVCYVATCN